MIARTIKLRLYDSNFGTTPSIVFHTSAWVNGAGNSCSFRSKAMIVIMMAITPSLNASILFFASMFRK